MSGSFVAVEMCSALRVTANYDGQIASSVGPGASATASVTFATTGDCTGTGTTTSFAKNWFLPTTVGVGANYWVRATVVSGDTPTGASIGAWLQLNTDRTWTLHVAAGNSKDANVKFEIALDAAGASIVYTGTIEITADGIL